MKKISILLALAVIISLSSCGKNNINTNIKASSEITSSDSVSSEISSSDSSNETSSNLSTPLKEKVSKGASSNPSSQTPAKTPIKAPTKSISSKENLRSQASTKVNDDVLKERTQINQFSESDIEQKLLVLVNNERSRLNLSKLSWSNTLYKSAKIRSDEIAAANVDLGISHTRPNNTSWSTTLGEVNYSKYPAYTGENLAAVQQSINVSSAENNEKLANSIFNDWKNSKGHYEAIIRPDTKEIGIAVSRNKTNVYATQHFGQIN